MRNLLIRFPSLLKALHLYGKKAMPLKQRLTALSSRHNNLVLACLLANAVFTISAAPPGITFQPKSQSVVLHELSAFGVIAIGSDPLCISGAKTAYPFPMQPTIRLFSKALTSLIRGGIRWLCQTRKAWRSVRTPRLRSIWQKPEIWTARSTRRSD